VLDLHADGTLWEDAGQRIGQVAAGVQRLVPLNAGAAAFLTTGGDLFSWNGQASPTRERAGVQDIALWPQDGTLYNLDVGGVLEQRSAAGVWSRTNGALVQQMALGQDGTLYNLDVGGVLEQRSAAGVWSRVGQSGVVASDGSIWYLGTAAVDGAGDCAIYRLSNGLVTPVVGDAVSLLAVESTVWALNSANQLYRWNGTTWYEKAGSG
jgi:hypothetical protein